MTYDQAQELARQGTGPEAIAIIGTLMDEIQELHDYLGVVRIVDTIGFKLVRKAIVSDVPASRV